MGIILKEKTPLYHEYQGGFDCLKIIIQVVVDHLMHDDSIPSCSIIPAGSRFPIGYPMGQALYTAR